MGLSNTILAINLSESIMLNYIAFPIGETKVAGDIN